MHIIPWYKLSLSRVLSVTGAHGESCSPRGGEDILAVDRSAGRHTATVPMLRPSIVRRRGRVCAHLWRVAGLQFRNYSSFRLTCSQVRVKVCAPNLEALWGPNLWKLRTSKHTNLHAPARMISHIVKLGKARRNKSKEDVRCLCAGD